MSKKNLVLLLFGLSLIPIIETAYLGINGEHVWRQADVYSNILGFLNRTDIPPFADFFGRRIIFDIPIYSWIAAKTSLLFSLPALVATRYLNGVLFGLMVFSGFSLCSLWAGFGAGAVFVFLCGVSPLLMHYFSTPLPDVMATAFSLFALWILIAKPIRNWLLRLAVSVIFFGCATLIKSPIAFLFLVFYGVHNIFELKQNKKEFKKVFAEMFVVGSVCLICAIAAELLRKALIGPAGMDFAQDPSWYFGTLELRLSSEFWIVMVDRFKDFGLPSFTPFILISIAAITWCKSAAAKKIFISSVAAVLSGWIVFSNVYFVHNYYEIPACVVILLSFAISLNQIAMKVSFLKKSFIENRFAWALILVLFLGIKLVQPRMSEKTRKDIVSVVNVAMLGSEQRLLMVNPPEPKNPTIAGRVSHLAKSTSLEQFDAKCIEFARDYKFILLMNAKSSCEEQLAKKAEVVYRDESGVFLKL